MNKVTGTLTIKNDQGRVIRSTVRGQSYSDIKTRATENLVEGWFLESLEIAGHPHRYVKCKACGGRGFKQHSLCKECNGTGVLTERI